jgi:dTDP-4-dehydrorhamnose 3,5-epimerase
MIEGVVISKLSPHEDHRGRLFELFRCDESDYVPVMAYVSVTLPNVTRGPHEHREQSDYFCFFDGEFQLRLWDWTGTFETHNVGKSNPCAVLVPPGVIHAYENVGTEPSWVMNLPDRLYAGYKRKEAVDEIRHEDSATSVYW